MQPASICLFTRLFSAFLLGIVVCHLTFRDAETSTDDSRALVGEKSSDRAEPALSFSDHTFLRPIPDPGPGTKGFDPWANNKPIEVAVNCEGMVNCDGSICDASVAQRQKIPSGEKQPKGSVNDGPTLAFPTVLPRLSRGHLIEVGVEFLSEGKP